MENKPRRIPAGGISRLLTPNPRVLGSFPACKHHSLQGVSLGTAGAAPEGLLGLLLVSCSLIHSLNACVSGRGSGRRRRRSRGDEGTGGGGGRGPHYLFARTKYKAFVLG